MFSEAEVSSSPGWERLETERRLRSYPWVISSPSGASPQWDWSWLRFRQRQPLSSISVTAYLGVCVLSWYFNLNIKIFISRMDTSDNSSLLLFSTLARGLRHKVKTFIHFYCGITENFGLPGYVFRNSSFKIELLQYHDCIENICDKMMKVLMHSNDRSDLFNIEN